MSKSAQTMAEKVVKGNVSLKCLACQRPIAPVDFTMTCSNPECCSAYHHSCLRMSDLEYKNYPTDKKAHWVCPNCCRDARSGVKSDTPVRQAKTLEDISKKNQSPGSTWVNPNRGGSSNSKVPQEKPKAAPEPSVHKCLEREEIVHIFRTELRNTLLKEVKSMMDQYVSSKLDTLRSDTAYLKKEFDDIKSSISFLDAKYEEIKSDFKTTSEQNKKLQKEVENLTTNNKELKRELAEMQQHARASNVEIQCVPEHRSENLVTTVMQLAKIVSYHIVEEDIQLCTRTAKLDHTSKRPRSIVVKLKNPIQRDGFLAAVLKFNKAHQDDKINSTHLGIGGDKKPIYIIEHLSPYNREIHRAARLRAREKGYKFVWVRNGRVFARKNESTGAIILKDLDSVNKL